MKIKECPHCGSRDIWYAGSLSHGWYIDIIIYCNHCHSHRGVISTEY